MSTHNETKKEFSHAGLLSAVGSTKARWVTETEINSKGFY